MKTVSAHQAACYRLSEALLASRMALFAQSGPKCSTMLNSPACNVVRIRGCELSGCSKMVAVIHQNESARGVNIIEALLLASPFSLQLLLQFIKHRQQGP